MSPALQADCLLSEPPGMPQIRTVLGKLGISNPSCASHVYGSPLMFGNSRLKILEGCLQARTARPYSDFSEKCEAVRVNLLVGYDFLSVQARIEACACAHTPPPHHASLPLLVCLKAHQPGPSNTPLCLFEQHNPQEILEPLITHGAHRNFSSLPPHLRRQKRNFTP